MKFLITIFFFGFIAFSARSQYRSSIINTFSTPGGPGISGGGNIGFTQDVNSPSVPFDGGLSFLLLGSGIAYIGKKQKAGLLAI